MARIRPFLMSNLYAPTLKEDPAEAELASHRLLLRAGMIRRQAAGFYTYLPLAWRSIKKIEDIAREEMDALGAQEIRMPILQAAELWYETGRWDDYGPELMRLHDRHDREMCLGPTHEEIVTDLVRNEIRSYRDLPVTLYQIQAKFRDEIRPRFGLLRSREFIMKDAYSFNDGQESLDKSYEEMKAAYARFCERLDLEYRAVTADSGQIGGHESHEFMALAESGEAELAYCDCGYAADIEAAHATIHIGDAPHDPELTLVQTPGAKTMALLAEFLQVDENVLVKAIAVKDAEGEPHILFVPGDHDLNDVKTENILGVFDMLEPEDFDRSGLSAGYIGPVGMPEGIDMIADNSLRKLSSWICGANQPDAHYVGIVPGRDFSSIRYHDIVEVKEGDLCLACGEPLKTARGIEVSQIFQLGDKYSGALKATFADEADVEHPFLMGCYGIGISRSLAAVIEQHNDEHGIIWPVSIAPYEVSVIALNVDDEVVWPVAQRLASELGAAGIEVILDDRNERAGVKFAEADLMGFPYQLICGKRGIENGEVELKHRATGERKNVKIDDVVNLLSETVTSQRTICEVDVS